MDGRSSATKFARVMVAGVWGPVGENGFACSVGMGGGVRERTCCKRATGHMGAWMRAEVLKAKSFLHCNVWGNEKR